MVVWTGAAWRYHSPAKAEEAVAGQNANNHQELPLAEQSFRRRPIAVVDCQDHLVVANGDSGTLSVLDWDTQEVQGEFKVASKLSALGVLENRLIALDPERHELLSLDPKQEGDNESIAGFTVRERLPISRYPQSLAIQANEKSGVQIAVTSLWSQRLTLLDQNNAGKLQATHVVDLPFAPHDVLFLPQNRVLVADAFGGMFGIVDAVTGEILRLADTPLHQMRGLNLRGDSIYCVAQMLDPNSNTTFNEIREGLLMDNGVLELPLEILSDAEQPFFSRERFTRIGSADIAAGDLANMLPISKGWLLLGGGTNGLIFLDHEFVITIRIDTWRRPLAAVRRSRKANNQPKKQPGSQPVKQPEKQPEQWAVAYAFADGISFVDANNPTPPQLVELGPARELPSAERGEQMFFDASRSFGGWMSCGSCHVLGHTNHGLADTLGDGNYGAAKKVLPLGGVADTNDWAWDGHVRELGEQVTASFETSMQGDKLSQEQIRDVTNYLFTLEFAPSLIDARQQRESLAKKIAAGRRVFESQKCGQCHVPTLTYTIDGKFDVGLTDAKGLTKFNPPSLRGVSQRRTLLHDARATSVRDVIGEWKHPGNTDLTAEQLDALATFLISL